MYIPPIIFAAFPSAAPLSSSSRGSILRERKGLVEKISGQQGVTDLKDESCLFFDIAVRVIVEHFIRVDASFLMLMLNGDPS